MKKYVDDIEFEKKYCVECGKSFYTPRDIELCDVCVKKFDLNKLWKLHDQNKIDALDFNESKSLRNRFRKKKLKDVV